MQKKGAFLRVVYTFSCSNLVCGFEHNKKAMAATDGVAKVRFLQDMAEKFEAEGNLSESVKSAETALLFRKSLPVDAQPLFPQTLVQQAKTLISKCNQLGVDHFQRDEFTAASFFLSKGLFFTEETASSNCFVDYAHDRLRLRAATLNNMACLEKRRGDISKALEYLQKAVELETLVDPDVGASPSSNLNLCTLLNKQGKHLLAAAAADRAVKSLLYLQSQKGHENLPSFAQMLCMAYYNLAVSFELCGRPGDNARAYEAYGNVLDIARRFSLPENSAKSTIETAQEARRRLQETMGIGNGMLPPIGSSRSDVSSVVSLKTPKPPSVSRVSQPPNGEGTQPPVLGLVHMDTATKKHAERIMSRQRRKEAMMERDQIALKRAQKAHVREKAEKLRKEREQEEQRREEMAKVMYDRMVSGLLAEEIRRVKSAAICILSYWRGYVVRDYIKTMTKAAIKIQSVVRAFLCRLNIKRNLELEREAARNAALIAKQTQAITVIQRRVRQFLRRLAIIRRYKAHQLRKYHSAKKIQKNYRAHRLRMEQAILEKLEKEQKADAERIENLNKAARKIQCAYRAFKSRRFLRVVKLEQIHRNEAATKIQAVVRGALTRAWFRQFKLYRRQQELNTQQNLQYIIKIQKVWRGALARKWKRRVLLENKLKEQKIHLFRSARRIQCAYRSHIARQRTAKLRAKRQRREEAAAAIQSRWRVYVCRRTYLWRRDEARKLLNIRRIQCWWRSVVVLRKQRETARYHYAVRKREQQSLIRTSAALAIQSAAASVLSQWLTASLRRDYMRRSAAVTRIQSAGRQYFAAKECLTLRRISWLVDQQARHEKLCNHAACVIQRATRVYLAKVNVFNRRRQKAAAIRIQKNYRMHLCQKELKRLKKEKQSKLENAAASRIQRSVRLFLKRQELKRLDVYYTAKRKEKLLEQRREEAAITIQALWRGYATRKAAAEARSRMMQNAIDAIRIQRAYRTHRFRERMVAELKRRADAKKRVRQAAVTIQCAWRRVLAHEYVAMLRERRFYHTVSAICIQCAWRSAVARSTMKARKLLREKQRIAQAARQDAWGLACTIVQRALRTLQAGLQTLALRESTMAAQVAENRRRYEAHRTRAAVKIQATYRGFYERVYARGLRREKLEKDRKELEAAQRRHRAACCIQRAVRCHFARAKVKRLRYEKQLQFEAEQIERERTMDPRTIIQQLFWAREASSKSNISREKDARYRKQDKCATLIQSVWRMYSAKKYVKLQLEKRNRERAAKLIQDAWQAKEGALKEKRLEQQVKAATTIQRIFRGFVVRLHWEEKRFDLSAKKKHAVVAAERRDEAATEIQSLWRGVRARRRCETLRERRVYDKESSKERDAAVLIQKMFRGHLARRRVRELRQKNVPRHPVPPPRNIAKSGAPPPRRGLASTAKQQ